jgi:DNA-binding NtrC family response regulator
MGSARMNPKHTILYVGENLAPDNSIVGRLKSAGYNMVSASRSTEAVAKLFANHIEAIVLDQRSTEKINLGLAKFVKSFRAAVPVILLSTQLLDPLPRCIDAGVCLQEELSALVPTIELLLDSEATI